MSKQYGLIIPGQQQKHPAIANSQAKTDVPKPSIFDESSESDEGGPPQLKLKPCPMAPGATEKRMAKKMQEKALEEDPTIFQYDELYDEMESKRDEEKKAKTSEVKKPKYIGRLLEYAERRKIENERRIERMVQKEREQEGDEFKDKESFVTSAYRKKLEEMQKIDQQELREDYLESIGDVTKQKDLDGFYRHLYEQTTSTSKPVEKPTPSACEEVSYKPIKSGKARAYRKRRSSAEDEEDQTKQDPVKKTHIQSNIDADSDFSIDSSSGEEDNETDSKIQTDKKPKDSTADGVAKSEIKIPVIHDIKPGVIPTENDNNNDKSKKIEDSQLLPAPLPKKDKSLIWKKRTVGDVFDAALQRYYQRVAMRNAA